MSESNNQHAKTFAIVTPSYAPDLERCRLLTQSIRRHARINYRHYILVARRDHPAFASLADERTEVLMIEEALGQGARLGPSQKEIWEICGITRINGWVFQQIVKIHTAQQAREDIVIFVDSDTVFIRTFDETHFVRNGLVRLFRHADLYDDMFASWAALSQQHLGLPALPDKSRFNNYISNVITWIPNHVRAMCERIEKISGASWIETLVRAGNLSEYMLYGAFADQVLGTSSGHYHDEHSIAHEHWQPEEMDEESLENFLKKIRDRDIAVMITAKAGIDPKRYAALFDRF